MHRLAAASRGGGLALSCLSQRLGGGGGLPAAGAVAVTWRRPGARSRGGCRSGRRQHAACSVAIPQPHAGTATEWDGLRGWRAGGLDVGRHWGDKGPEPAAGGGTPEAGMAALPGSLAACGLEVLLTADPQRKIALSHMAWRAYLRGELPLGSVSMHDVPQRPRRPEKPELVHPKKIPSPKKSLLPLNVYMLHTLAHIELNAIDLAWDTVARFSSLGLPEEFYADFAHVADDESRHLGWCLQRLEELGHAYGDMPAHDLLWEGAQLSSDDLSWRMCVVPMSQEARGLDAGPRLAGRMEGFGDNRSAKIVSRIALEEKAHVAVGVAWFNRVCAALERPAEASFRDTMARLCPDLLTGFFNHDARQEVGLPQTWYDLSTWPEDEAAPVCRSAGLVVTDPRKRCEPSGPKMEPPVRLDARELEMLGARLANLVDVEAASAGQGGGR